MMNLTLDDPVKDQVSGTYKRVIRTTGGGRATFKVPTFYSDTPLHIHVAANNTATVIPMDPTTLARLHEIDNFVLEQVNSGNYKPLYKGDRIMLNFSRWCKYEKLLPDGTRQPMPEGTALGPGMYSISINASHIYFGPHKNGESHSVSLHICELLYEPEQNLSDVLKHIMETPPPMPTPTVQPPPPSKLKLKRQPRFRKMRGLDEVLSSM